MIHLWNQACINSWDFVHYDSSLESGLWNLNVMLVSFCFHGPFFFKFKRECQQLTSCQLSWLFCTIWQRAKVCKTHTHTHTTLRLLISCSCTPYINVFGMSAEHCDSVSRFGQAVRCYAGILVSRGTLVRICFSSPFSSKVLVFGHYLLTSSLTIMKV